MLGGITLFIALVTKIIGALLGFMPMLNPLHKSMCIYECLNGQELQLLVDR